MKMLLTGLYRFCLAWTEIDLVIARSTGRSPSNIAQLSSDRDHYESLLCNLEIQP